ncbi:MAG TPA: hypothetical protein VFC63_22345 [Blastocatellia bacterium]|nr:hypothetical protein [Blastocatellia bacterium]
MVQRALTVLIALCLFAQGSFAIGQSKEWIKYSSPEGRFTVLFPSQPTENKADVDTVAGKIAMHSFLATSENNIFLLIYADFPEYTDFSDPEHILDAGRDGGLRNAHAELISEKRVTMKGYPGREVIAKTVRADLTINMTLHFYLVKKRVYQVITGKFKESTEGDSKAEATKFFDSFDFTEPESKNEAAPSAPRSGEWVKFASSAGRFNSLFPLQPTERSSDIDTVRGKVSLHSITSERQDAAFLVAYADYPFEAKDAEIDGVLDGVRNVLIKNRRLVSEKNITMKGYPGIEFKAKAGSPTGAGMIGRIYLVKKRLYQVLIQYADTQRSAEFDKDVTKFLDSFDFNEPEPVKALATNRVPNWKSERFSMR